MLELNAYYHCTVLAQTAMFLFPARACGSMVSEIHMYSKTLNMPGLSPSNRGSCTVMLTVAGQ